MFRNRLLNSSLYYLLASVLVVLFGKTIHIGVIYLDTFYTYMNLLIAPIFNQAGLGKIVQQTLLLVFIPILVACIPALIYRLIKRQTMPYLIQVTWALWLVLSLSSIIIH